MQTANQLITDDGRIRRIDANGIINTIAGNGVSNGFSGNEMEALSATLGGGIYVGTNPSGTLYISMILNHRICILGPQVFIKSLKPMVASAGTVITIKSSLFSGATSVSFGGVSATSFSVIDDSTISATVATGTSGSVRVTTPGGSALLPGFIFLTTCTWNGAANTIWENAANWTCGKVPDSTSTVSINSGTVVLNSNAIIWSLSVGNAASFTINPPYVLKILH